MGIKTSNISNLVLSSNTQTMIIYFSTDQQDVGEANKLFMIYSRGDYEGI